MHLAHAILGGHVDSRVYTLDNNARHVTAARDMIAGYRLGLLLPRIEFIEPHVDLETWLSTPDPRRNEPFDGAVLDLPESHLHVAGVAAMLRRGAGLVVFSPSITQIVQLIEHVDMLNRTHESLRLLPIDCYELAESYMRPWDVRTVQTRADGKTATVCRPRVGDRTQGGGFLCLLHRAL